VVQSQSIDITQWRHPWNRSVGDIEAPRTRVWWQSEDPELL